ncbi:sigma-70 family RNA polymerase sigma factor (plasmid) [Streptomyces clavuligerus]|uniref:RNA polymerase sigma factor n=1 Tax=Streptomyces clavuligerus TaxID=1901 RepID=UPI0001852050|nr:sigma-70 family RNA polymerase sigma factor [Streptomyces clavuligerus]ANW22636.1 RNA polymerase [Streptomyces clavuligerus]AXU16895.1 sigma-70 family RNA polymerase sigma factor [Streptomyces clavuligerus]AXU17495.1 sigma-70 family RNA polymerase sigma factor [Streptomyces clavuligerus]MBY6301028.1 sigma-70 family RNA polymerase sigma factor [Streptomyces clavuligerus]QPL66865.1 sigma-70 family RNA polymerase sigma factor [Streptomyces clavuligerus]
MTDDVEEHGGQPVTAAPLPLPLDFEAYYITHQEAFHQYALAILGTNDAAEKAIHRAFLEILRHWDTLLSESDLQQQVWAIVRRTVMSEILLDLRAQLATLDDGTGLYKALAALPPRQFDVVVLRHIVCLKTHDISWYMGLTPSTVDYHCRRARERLDPVYRRTTRRKQEDTK